MASEYSQVFEAIKRLEERRLGYLEKLVEMEIFSWQRDLVTNYDVAQNTVERQKLINKRHRLMTKFVDLEGRFPLSNYDAIKKNNLRRNLPNFRKKYEWNNNIWLPSEIKKLKKLVKVHLLKSILEVKTSLGITDYSQDSVFGGNSEGDKDESRIMVELNRLLALQSERNRNFSTEEYWTEFWNLVSLDLGNRCERTGRDCQITWYHFVDPNINRRPWDKKEDLRLLALVSENKGFNWIGIAQDLNSGRTPYQCIFRYQRSLNKDLIKSTWSKEEDERLISAVESFGGFEVLELNKRSTSKWNLIANLLPGRTNQQCRTRYVRSLKKDLKHGSWSLYEDVRLQFAYFVYGSNSWTRISRHIQGRSDSKCRERYMNMLLPELKKGRWTPEENRTLALAVSRYGPGNWSLIKNFVIGRTDADCSKQWEKLDPASSFQYDIIRATEKRMLPQSYKWIGISRSNHKLLNSIQDYNRSRDKGEIIKPKLSGSDFFLESAQSVLKIAHFILSNFESGKEHNNYVSNYYLEQLIQQIKEYKTDDYKVDNILSKIQRSLAKLVKKRN
ncbi:MYB-like DNA-binding domain-containing protein [Cryptosporidium felis]|nr:MYB-like DNA-binding domain-containing protein [Cryptosporidium felis]